MSSETHTDAPRITAPSDEPKQHPGIIVFNSLTSGASITLWSWREEGGKERPIPQALLSLCAMVFTKS
jgi:hypothetical protein